MHHMEKRRAIDQLQQRPPTFMVFARADGKWHVGSQGYLRVALYLSEYGMVGGKSVTAMQISKDVP